MEAESAAGSSSMSKAEILRGVVAEKLTTAALEILAVVERTVAGYEEEASGLRQEIDRQSRQLELLLQPRVKLERIDDEFPVCEPTAGGETEEEEQHKPEPIADVGDGESLWPVCFSEPPMEEEDKEDQESLTEPDYEAASRLLTPTVQSVGKKHGMPRIRQSQDHIDFRMRILEDSQIKVLSVEVYKKYPVRELRCPRDLQEPDFLDLLRSTFPQLAAQKPFDVLTSDRSKRLHPLRLETLTPEEIYRSVRSTGHSALYIQLKTQEELKSTHEELNPSQRNDAAARSPSSPDRTRISSPRVQPDRRKPGRTRVSEPQNPVRLRVRILEDSQVDVLTPYALQKFPPRELRCPPGLLEPDFLDLLRSTFPQLAAQKPFDFFTIDQTMTLRPLRAETWTPEEIHRTAGRSGVYIRLKRPGEDSLQRREDASGSPSSDQLRPNTRVEPDGTKPGSPQITDPQNHVDLRICILEDSQIDVLSPSVYKKYPVLELQVRHGLQEADFLDLLRSTFPQLAAQKPFDLFTSDRSKRLHPLRVETLTPEEIYRSVRLNGAGNSALYIRLKAEDEVWEEELHPADAVDDSSSASDQTWLNMSSRSQHEDMESENKKDDGSKSAVGRLWSLLVLSEGNGDGAPVSDDDWKLDKSENHVRDKEPKKTTRRKKRKVRIKPKGWGRRRQQRQPTDSDPLSCKVCQALRRSTNMLIRHAWSHVDEPERLCGVCGERPDSVDELRNHLQGHQKTHCCDICGKSFLTVVGLNGHVAHHNGQKPHKCQICHKAFVHAWVLKSHMRRHPADKLLKCDLCPQSYDSEAKYLRHKLIHKGEKPCRCYTCGKTFASLEMLSKHLSTHAADTTSGAALTCQICSKTFKAKHALKVHMRVHTGEKPFSCPICRRAFSYKHCMRRHMKMHNDTLEDGETEAQILSDRLKATKSVKHVR
ncbi:uncharacterized protein LOC119026691 isoform X1 [Acanthopagrus latus]|uniref:uncharacterized protein LOC119026691 isoform X1 n=1 Tax=Acanthopagrus latus TaxID=8177 RepID=UPI00187BCEAB|nr:uncharacterized protein LOC119026691 isoform X1 [Acanthopagrus latus]